ncbi:GAF domain-containing protein [Aerosakkonemataceae cyanobacterium BLCC-F154]|uniref:GAF domain-containing protein n=1 Tax=Floridaenema fluviatile BLCC-F154 TaxID=3153640 RepID=A0ABV4YG99_9CYAN
MIDPGLQRVINRLGANLSRDLLVQKTTNNLREFLQVDRVVLYYFVRQWEGRVTFESLSSSEFSIFGNTGPDECFNGEYAAKYEAGRVRAIPDIETAAISECHRDFLRNLKVRANLAVPILNNGKLWGLLIAHHCRDTRSWSESDILVVQKAAQELEMSPVIRDN